MSDVAIWIVIFHLGVLGLNWPLLEVFHGAQFAYLLGFWLVFVLLVWLASRREGQPPADRG